MSEWRCKRCGLCCRIFSMDIEKSLSIEEMQFFDNHTNMWAITPNLLAFEGKCKYLGHKNKEHFCKIYDKRPKWCREFNEANCKTVHQIKEVIEEKKRLNNKRR